MEKYSNMRAMRSLIKASLQSILKSPSAIVFTIAFPLIFILVFGFLGNGSGFHIRVAAAPGSDTSGGLYSILHKVDVLKWVDGDTASINKMLKQGDIVATIDIVTRPLDAKPRYKIVLNAASTEPQKAEQLKRILAGVVESFDPEIAKRQEDLLSVEMHESKVKELKTIDFVLPGQLGFSLLASGVFGTAFVFYNLRQTLVLKRFFATPVRKDVIVISEGIARMLFQIIGSIIILAIGHFAFGYTLCHGWVTFVQMLALCCLALLVFMGFGFIISGVAKSEGAIPPFSNLITLPQFLLAGTFFSIDNFPKWLQPFCRALPLTYLNDALRRIAFEGVGFWEVRVDIILLLCWGVVVYAIAGKTFKWE